MHILYFLFKTSMNDEEIERDLHKVLGMHEDVHYT